MTVEGRLQELEEQHGITTKELRGLWRRKLLPDTEVTSHWLVLSDATGPYEDDPKVLDRPIVYQERDLILLLGDWSAPDRGDRQRALMGFDRQIAIGGKTRVDLRKIDRLGQWGEGAIFDLVVELGDRVQEVLYREPLGNQLYLKLLIEESSLAVSV